jgi:hypothetical protein
MRPVLKRVASLSPDREHRSKTDLDFATVQESGLGAGLVDNKRCAIDGDWQALRFVYRRSDRSPGRTLEPDVVRSFMLATRARPGFDAHTYGSLRRVCRDDRRQARPAREDRQLHGAVTGRCHSAGRSWLVIAEAG